MKSQVFLFLLILIIFLPQYTKAENLSQEEKQGLQLMREEEKLAHDVYTFLYEKWQIPIFNNISNSEMRHYNAVGYLLENFNVEDPAIQEEGMFANLELEHLYDSLTLAGSTSLASAFEVGAFIEELDIDDLQNLLEHTTVDEITIVYQNLLRGSRNHIRAFTWQLENRGFVYKPKVLAQANYTSIIKADHEAGNGNGPCLMAPGNFGRKNGNKNRFLNRGNRNSENN